jgi:Flp pilus assembly protein TadD
MLFTRLRFVLIGLFLVLGVVLHLQVGMKGAWYLYVAALLLLLTHLFFGPVWQAFQQLKAGFPQTAAKLLRQVWIPGLLVKRNQAYYYFTKGMLELQREELDVARPLLEKALSLGLQSANDRALLQLNLAHIYFVKKDLQTAATYLDQAEAEDAKDLMIQENLKKMRTVLAQKR